MEKQALTDAVSQFSVLTKAPSLSQQISVTFHGEDITKFIEDLEEHFAMTNIEGDARVILTSRALRGEAKIWYGTIGRNQVKSESQGSRWSKFVDVFSDKACIVQRLYSTYQFKNESALQFINRKITDGSKLNLKDDEISNIVIPRLPPGLQDPG